MANTTKTTTTRSGKTTLTKKPPRSPAAARKASARKPATEINPEVRYRMIAEAAYLRAEQRGFNGGDPLDDWLTAEREVDLLLTERATQVTQ